MTHAEEELGKYKLYVRESDSSERDPIDFTIENVDDNVAWVHGNSLEDIDYECSHPTEPVWDDEDYCECPVCGETCDWHLEKVVVDEGHDADGDYFCKEAEVRVVDCWNGPRPYGVGGLIGEYIKEAYGRK